MRKVFRVLLLMAIVLSACESEQKRSNMATGMLALNLATSQDVIEYLMLETYDCFDGWKCR